MGMRVGGGYGAGWGNYQTSSSINAHQQKQQAQKNLFSALQSGDVTAAQTAFTALQNQGIPANSPLNAIGQALQNGDLAGAQKAAQSMRAAHAQRMHANDGDADDANSPSMANVNAASTSAATASGSAPVDTATALSAFMQNLEAALEQQDPNFSASAANTSANGASTTPSTQAVLWSKGGGFSQTTSAATLKSDLDSLIQQLSSTSTSDPTATATSSSITGSSTAPIQSTASALQSSFSDLIGSMGGQSSSASVMNFLQSLDTSLGSAQGSLNVAA